MIGRYRAGVVPTPGEADALDQELRAVAEGIAAPYDAAMGDYDPQAALEAVWKLVTRANRYVEQTAPWTLAKAAKGGDATATARLDSVLYNLAEALRVLAVYLVPFLPATAAAMLTQLGQDPALLATAGRHRAWGGTAPGTQVGTPTPLFPRLV
jgi:methionyl-tRNA synthetase